VAAIDGAFKMVDKEVTQNKDVWLIMRNKYKKNGQTQHRNSKEQRSYRFEQVVDRSVNQQILY